MDVLRIQKLMVDCVVGVSTEPPGACSWGDSVSRTGRSRAGDSSLYPQRNPGREPTDPPTSDDRGRRLSSRRS